MKRIIQAACLAAILSLAAGCGDTAPQSSSGAAPDHAAEARQTITPENMDRHLESLEAEIAADEAVID